MHMMGRVQQMPEKRAREGTMRRVARSFYPYWRESALVLLAILITAALGQVNPVVMGLIIDEAIRHKDLNELTLLVIVMFITPVGAGLINVGQTYLNATVGQQ